MSIELKLSSAGLSNLGIFDLKNIEFEIGILGRKKRVIRASLRWLYRFEKPARAIEDQVHAIVGQVHDKFLETSLELVRRQDSVFDHSSKCALKTRDGYVIESVIIRSRHESRTTLCLSSQVGCTEKCSFCATASMGFKRNLTVIEILEQLHKAQSMVMQEGRRITHVVFMGMGEPLRNLENVMESIGVMLSSRGFHLSPTSITVSTLGLPEQMLRFSRQFPQVQLALSLHAADEHLRSELMPINLKHSIVSLLRTIEEIESIRSGTIMISYLMFEGLNDAEEQAHQLAQTFINRRVMFNLIPFNQSEIVSSKYRAVKREQHYRFRAILMEYGFLVTIRESFGKDIDAACGQLALKSS